MLVQWERIKEGERAVERKAQGSGTVFKDLPPRLPALMFAEAVWKQIEKKRLPAGRRWTAPRWRRSRAN